MRLGAQEINLANCSIQPLLCYVAACRAARPFGRWRRRIAFLELLGQQEVRHGRGQLRVRSRMDVQSTRPTVASPPTPPVRSPSVDSEADVVPALRRSAVQRGQSLMRQWGSGLSVPAPRPPRASMGPADFAALAVRRDVCDRRGASYAFLARGTELSPSPADSMSDADRCEHGQHAIGQLHPPDARQWHDGAQASDQVEVAPSDSKSVVIGGAAASSLEASEVARPSAEASGECASRRRCEDRGSSDEAIVLPRRLRKRPRSSRDSVEVL